MSPFVWLGVAVVAGAAAYFVAASALGRYRLRQEDDQNEARYRAWRGRAARPTQPPIRDMTPDERRQIIIGAILMAVAVAALIAFMVASS